MSVFPNDVSGFSCIFEAKGLTQQLFESFLLQFWLTGNNVCILLCSVDSFFVLESEEGSNWSVQGFKIFPVTLECVNLAIHFSHLVVSLEFNVLTSFSEQFNDFSIVEGK
jgi:hypothetical protein